MELQRLYRNRNKERQCKIEGLCRQNISRIRAIGGLDLFIQLNPVTDEAKIIVTVDKNGRVIIAIYMTEGMKKAVYEYEKTTWQMEAGINLKYYNSGLYAIVMQSEAQCLNESMVGVR